MALVRLNFESQCLGNNLEVGIILPDIRRDEKPAAFYGNEEKYKVLWLLHGTNGDYSDWIRKSNVERYACERRLMVVMPSALNSNYVNWPGFMTGYRMGDFLTEELMPLVHGWFPASGRRQDNFIAGLSMGGSGAMQYAVNHPEKFEACAVLSASPRNLREKAKNPDARMQNSIRNAGGYEAYVASDSNTWETLGKGSGKSALPRFYLTCGTEDFLYADYLEFKEYAQKLNLNAVFEEFEGYCHEWRFWDMTIQRAMDFFLTGRLPETDRYLRA